MARVVVTDSNFPTLDREHAAAADGGAEFEAHQCRSAEEVENVLRGAEVAVVQFAPVTAAAIAGMAAGGRLIRYGVGFNNIDVSAARSSGREVAYVPDYCTDEVADHTATLALALYRQVAAFDADVRAGRWGVQHLPHAIQASSAMQVGFLGLGRIGRATLARLKPFGFSFLVSDPAISFAEAQTLGVELRDRAELLAVADLVILHLPLTPETRYIIDAKALAGMKRGAMVVNTARGGLIQEEALAEALSSGHIAGAALDVFETEPLPQESPLRKAPNVLLSPHAAWYSNLAVNRLQALVADEITRALQGRPPRCPVPAST